MLPSTIAEITLEVPFHDCDGMQVVWHGNYAKYFELGCIALLREHDLDFPVVHALGFRVFVIESRCRYSFPLRYGDRFTVTSRFKQIDPCLVVSAQIHNSSRDRRSARAHTTLAFTNSERELLSRPPDEIRTRLFG